jgi:hypothetical protein
MGLFDDPIDLLALWATGGIPSMADVASAKVGEEIFHAGIQPDAEYEEALARSRWMAEHRAESSFPCGVVVVSPEAAATTDPWARPSQVPAGTVSVTAVVVPGAVVFLRDPIDGVDAELVVELGRIARAAIGEIDVVNAAGAHVPEPTRETLEPSEPVELVLRWANEGIADEDRFCFLSPWLAWDAGRRLLRAKSS